MNWYKKCSSTVWLEQTQVLKFVERFYMTEEVILCGDNDNT